jgi:hypothetical protein
MADGLSAFSDKNGVRNPSGLDRASEKHDDHRGGRTVTAFLSIRGEASSGRLSGCEPSPADRRALGPMGLWRRTARSNTASPMCAGLATPH